MDLYAKLPTDLHYLVGPAEKFGRCQFDDQIEGFLDSATESEMAELAAVAERFQLKGHGSELNAFLDQYPITEHDESARLYFLLGVIDAAGFKISDSNWNSVESHMESLKRFGNFRLASERSHAARFLADIGDDALPAIPLLETACTDEDERVQVWAHYALAKIEGDVNTHIDAIRRIFSAHHEIDEFNCYDEIGTEAEAALELLTGNSG